MHPAIRHVQLISHLVQRLHTWGRGLEDQLGHEDQAAASGWLQILASEGYNILGYLEKESDWHPGPIQLTIPSCIPIAYANERRLVFDWTVPPTVSWDWWASPKSSTFLLRQEFMLMAIKSLPDLLLIERS